MTDLDLGASRVARRTVRFYRFTTVYIAVVVTLTGILLLMDRIPRECVCR